MKRKFIDIRTTKNGEICDALCVNHASFEQLMAVLQLCETGDEVLVINRDEEVENPFDRRPVAPKDANPA